MAIAQWRARLQPASYNGVQFHVDVQARNSGRRIQTHEFPKRDVPWSEDMGRRAKRFPVTAYIIGTNYTAARDQLIAQLEKEGTGTLILPTGLTNTQSRQVVCEGYTVVERREQGGYCTFDMNFVEAGQDIWSQASPDTQGAVNTAANNATGATVADVARSASQYGIDPTNFRSAIFGSPLATGLRFAIPGAFMRSIDIKSLLPSPPGF
jgi:prophage DNA circulation protein